MKERLFVEGKYDDKPERYSCYIDGLEAYQRTAENEYIIPKSKLVRYIKQGLVVNATAYSKVVNNKTVWVVKIHNKTEEIKTSTTREIISKLKKKHNKNKFVRETIIELEQNEKIRDIIKKWVNEDDKYDATPLNEIAEVLGIKGLE